MTNQDPPLEARVRAWVALLLPPLAWYTFEIGLATALRLDCTAVGAWLGVAWGVVGVALCGAAVIVARPIARDDGDRTPSRPWLAAIARTGAGIFALAIAFQTAASAIVPSCGR